MKPAEFGKLAAIYMSAVVCIVVVVVSCTLTIVRQSGAGNEIEVNADDEQDAGLLRIDARDNQGPSVRATKHADETTDEAETTETPQEPPGAPLSRDVQSP